LRETRWNKKRGSRIRRREEKEKKKGTMLLHLDQHNITPEIGLVPYI
jgi:hypothetical protein